MPESTAEPDPARSPIPDWTRGTPSEGLTPIPTATGGIGTCEPTFTPTRTATFTPTLEITITATSVVTATPTLTATMTVTPTNTPECALAAATRQCPSVPQDCRLTGPGCTAIFELAAPPLPQCDRVGTPTPPPGPYALTVNATECGDGQYEQIPYPVRIRYAYQDGLNWSPWFNMRSVGGTYPNQWVLEEPPMLPGSWKPWRYELWWYSYYPGSGTKGIARIDVDYCCFPGGI
jgi:hypothetical protein